MKVIIGKFDSQGRLLLKASPIAEEKNLGVNNALAYVKMKELGIEEVAFEGKRVLWFVEGLEVQSLSEDELKKVEKVLDWTFGGDEWWENGGSYRSSHCN